MRLVWDGARTTRGFFLRAEDFFGFARRLARTRAEMEERLTEIDEEYRERSEWAKGLAAGPMRASLGDMTRRYGENLDARSHGESFLTLLQSRLVPKGLYLMDEPETPLSPQNVLTLMTMMLDAEENESQFIIATHSPILLAYPGATIYDFDATPVATAAYEELPHVQLTRDFLTEPGRFLRQMRAVKSPRGRHGP